MWLPSPEGAPTDEDDDVADEPLCQDEDVAEAPCHFLAPWNEVIEEAEAREDAETPHPTDDEDGDAAAVLEREVVVLLQERIQDLDAQALRVLQEQDSLFSMMRNRTAQRR